MAEENMLKAMGERIYNRRKALKLTQDELAERVGVSTQMISNLELGKKAIRPENLVKICRILDISADYILTGCTANLSENHVSQKLIDRISEKLVKLSPEELNLIESFINYMTD